MFAPTPLRVRLPFRSEDEFVDQYGAHVGRDGFFLATRAPKPVGAQLLFDLVLADGSSLLRGEGVVVKSNASGERPGMTLRFVRLEAAGKALVERILSSRAAPAPAEPHVHPSAWAPPTGPVAPPPAVARRDPVPRPAGPADWAPPAASVRREPPVTASPPEPAEAALPPESPPSAASPEVLDPGEQPSEMSAAWEREEASAAQAAEAEPGASTRSPQPSPEVSEAAADPSEDSRQLESTPLLESRPELETTPLVDAIPVLGGSPALETESAAPPVDPGSAPATLSSEPVPVPVPDSPPAGSSAGALEDTSLEAWSAELERAPTDTAEASVPEAGPPVETAPPAEGASAAAPASAESGGPATTAHPPLDESELPELVVTEFKGPGALRPVGLAHTRASGDVHAAITPPAGTLIVTELDEPPPDEEPRFQLEAPVRGDEPLALPESSFHDVAKALGREPASVHERPTTPIPLMLSMETAALDEVPIPPPPPPLDVAPIPEEGAVRIEPGAPEPGPAPVTPVETRAAATPEPAVETRAPEAPRAPEPDPAPVVPVLPRPEATPERAVETRPAEAPAAPAPEVGPASPAPRRAVTGTAALGIEIDPESIRVSRFHDGRAEALVLDPGRGRVDAPVRLVREPGAPPRMLPPDAPDPALWVGAPLSFLGLRADSDVSRTVARRWPAPVVADDRGEAGFALEGGTVGAAELLAALLRWVRHRAEELTSQTPGRVVISVPVAFNALQRERLRDAAERAGFEGVRLVQAPTAATMAFAHGRGLARRRILVFRMGASTCDIAVLAAAGDDLDMVACAGDAALGSMNFDEQIALALDKGARADAGVLRKRIAEAAHLRTQLEDPALSDATVEGAHLTRVELEARTTALVERGVLLAREVLRSASLTPDALDELVLVGAATRLPHVRRMIEEAMGRAARTDVDVSAAVSLGAATLAHLLVAAGPKSASRTALHEVLGVPLEIIAPELGPVRVLDRNTRLPAEKTITLPLPIGTPLEVQVFQGPARAPDPRSFLGLLRAPADRAGDWTLTLSIDADGVLRASATNPSGKRHALQLQAPAPSAEGETPPPQRVPSEPETPAAPPKQDTGLFGGLRRLFGRR